MSSIQREVVYEGWLIKSPPTKRILKARWRKRWFTLRHSGELPGQFFLEYYTDRNCRKLKGRIDLDQCEQVDAGLHFEQRKLKYPYMFDVKTPNRVYYLAADSEIDMNNWVDCICKVCGLKAYTFDENELDVGVENLPPPTDLALETPPLSPASAISGPYIPISECVTGRPLTAMNANHHIQLMLQQELYDSPRVLSNPGNCTPPLQSPTDSESVFTDDEWSHPVMPSVNETQRTSVDSMSCVDPVEPWAVTQRFGKLAVEEEIAPPRPPKPTRLNKHQPAYLNLGKSDTHINDKEDCSSQVVTMDTMYDFPRSHQVESEGRTPTTRHCYNNAAPGEGNVFRYDAAAVYENSVRPEECIGDEPASPASVQSSTTYSNLPSPAPAVNRGLKPGRKLSDSASICSLVEPPSPRSAPSIDRKLKPSVPPRKPNDTDDMSIRSSTNRAAPSPVPPNQNSHFISDDDLDNNEQIYFYQVNNEFIPGGFEKLQYLDLDLDSDTNGATGHASFTVPRSPDSLTVYHQVDFIKTEAFMKTRRVVEEERKQCSVEP